MAAGCHQSIMAPDILFHIWALDTEALASFIIKKLQQHHLSLNRIRQGTEEMRNAIYQHVVQVAVVNVSI